MNLDAVSISSIYLVTSYDKHNLYYLWWTSHIIIIAIWKKRFLGPWRIPIFAGFINWNQLNATHFKRAFSNVGSLIQSARHTYHTVVNSIQDRPFSPAASTRPSFLSTVAITCLIFVIAIRKEKWRSNHSIHSVGVQKVCGLGGLDVGSSGTFW